jgi:hypothetical protein
MVLNRSRHRQERFINETNSLLLWEFGAPLDLLE